MRFSPEPPYFGNEGRQPARLGQRIDEFLGISTLLVNASEAPGGTSAEIPDAGANVGVKVGCCHARRTTFDPRFTLPLGAD